MFRVDQRIGDKLPAPENVAIVLQGYAVFGAGFNVGHGKGGHAAMRQAAQVFDIQGGIQAAHDVGEAEGGANGRVNVGGKLTSIRKQQSAEGRKTAEKHEAHYNGRRLWLAETVCKGGRAGPEPIWNPAWNKGFRDACPQMPKGRGLQSCPG